MLGDVVPQHRVAYGEGESGYSGGGCWGRGRTVSGWPSPRCANMGEEEGGEPCGMGGMAPSLVSYLRWGCACTRQLRGFCKGPL